MNVIDEARVISCFTPEPEISKADVLSWCSRRWNDWPDFPYGRFEYFFAPPCEQENVEWENMLSVDCGKRHSPQMYGGIVKEWAASKGIKLTIKEVVAQWLGRE